MHLETQCGELVAQPRASLSAVVDDKDAASLHLVGWYAVRRRGGLHLQPDLELETDARARMRAPRNSAAHLRDETLRDVQAQSGSAERARRGMIGLRERLEQTRDLRFRHADAGVLDAEAQKYLAVALLRLGKFDEQL